MKIKKAKGICQKNDLNVSIKDVLNGMAQRLLSTAIFEPNIERKNDWFKSI